MNEQQQQPLITYYTKQCFDFWLNCELAFRFAASKKISFCFCLCFLRLLWICIHIWLFSPWLNWRKIQYYNRINVITSNFMQQLLHYELIWVLFRFHFHSCQICGRLPKNSFSPFLFLSILFRWRSLSLFSKFQTIIRNKMKPKGNKSEKQSQIGWCHGSYFAFICNDSKFSRQLHYLSVCTAIEFCWHRNVRMWSAGNYSCCQIWWKFTSHIPK